MHEPARGLEILTRKTREVASGLLATRFFFSNSCSLKVASAYDDATAFDEDDDEAREELYL